jgi:hypothetical protein
MKKRFSLDLINEVKAQVYRYEADRYIIKSWYFPLSDDPGYELIAHNPALDEIFQYCNPGEGTHMTPYWVRIEKLPPWWDTFFPSKEDFQQEDIEAAIDFIKQQ